MKYLLTFLPNIVVVDTTDDPDHTPESLRHRVYYSFKSAVANAAGFAKLQEAAVVISARAIANKE